MTQKKNDITTTRLRKGPNTPFRGIDKTTKRRKEMEIESIEFGKMFKAAREAMGLSQGLVFFLERDVSPDTGQDYDRIMGKLRTIENCQSSIGKEMDSLVKMARKYANKKELLADQLKALTAKGMKEAHDK